MSRKALINRLVACGVALLLVSSLTGVALAQDQSSGQPSGDQSGQDAGAPPAATGLDTQTQITENPPVSGLDQPSFEPGYGARSYLVPTAQASESVQSNSNASVTNPTGVGEITRLIGGVDLQKLWKIHPLDLNYIGGGAWFNNYGRGWYQVHTLAATQRILWRTGQLAIRDQFSYLPQGSFGFGSFGGAGGIGGLGGFGGGVGLGGGSFNGNTFGTNGNIPRINNLGIIDVTQALSPRSSVVVLGGFGILDFLNTPPGLVLVKSEQTMAQAGYNYALTRKDQIGVSYGFQEFHFPTANAGDINVNLWQVYYAHRISGRMDLTAGGGPQWMHINGYALGIVNGGIGLVPLHTSRISGAGRAGLTYHWSQRTNMALNYFHFVTPGSGFFAGATTDVVRAALNRQLTRRWSGTVDTGFSRNSRILATPSGTGVAGNSHTYDYLYAGASMRRQLSRHLQAFATYQYDKMVFGSGFCTGSHCRAHYGQSIGMVGIDWTPRPIRLD